MNYNLVFRNVETIDGKRKEIVDNTKTLKDWSQKLQNLTVKGGDINSAQLNQLINDSERKKTKKLRSFVLQVVVEKLH